MIALLLPLHLFVRLNQTPRPEPKGYKGNHYG